MGTAAEGAATSLETLPRRVLQEGRQHGAAAPHGEPLCAGGWTVSQPVLLVEMPLQGGTHLALLPAMYARLFPGSAHCSRTRKMHQRLIMFLNLTFAKYAVGPMLVSLPLHPFPKDLIALSPC